MKRKFIVATLALSLIVGSGSSWVNNTLLKPIGLGKVDTVAHATGGGGSITPPRPQEETNDPPEYITSSDEATPLTDDFVTGVTYNNDYGYAIMEINQDRLNGGFVNQIKHIGIGSKKYTYRTVNKDKSNWFRIFVPYKFLPKTGSEDFYFYMGDKIYHQKLTFKSPYDRTKKLAPNLMAEETTPGSNKTVKFKVSYDQNYDINAWYDTVSKDSLTVISNFTMGNLRTDETNKVESVTVDRANNTISVKFKADYQFYNFYVHEFIFKSNDYINGYSYLVLYDEAPELTTKWSTNGDYSLNIDDKSHGVYLGELDEVKLTNKKTGVTKTLSEDKDYFPTWSNLNIKAKVFEPNTDYTITLKSSKTATKTLDVTSPAIPQIQEVGYVDIEDIEHNQDLTFKVDNPEWLKKVKFMTLYNRNGKPFELSLSNGDFTINHTDKTITVANEKFDNWTGNWSLVIPAEGYDDTRGRFFLRPEQGPFTNSSAPALEAEWATDGNFKITVPSDKYSSYMLNNSQINLIDTETGKVTPLYKATKREENDYPRGYEILLKKDFFKPGKNYKIRVHSNGYNSTLIDVPPREDIEIKTATAEAPSFLHDTPLKINSNDTAWLNAIKKITIEDERGFSKELAPADWTKDGNNIVINYDTFKDDLRRLPGELDITIQAKGYEDVTLTTNVLKDAPEAKYTPYGDKAHISFGGGSSYGYADDITKVTLNGSDLSTTQYTKEALGTGINIPNRYLIDGDNTVVVKNSKYLDATLTFKYDNKELRDMKTDLLENLKDSALSQDKKDEFKDKINNAKTLDELIGVKLAYNEADPDSKTRELAADKQKVLDKLNNSQLPADKIKEFKDRLDNASEKSEIDDISRDVDRAITRHFNDLRDEIYDEIDSSDKISYDDARELLNKLDDAKTVDQLKEVRKEFYKKIGKTMVTPIAPVASIKISDPTQKIYDGKGISPITITPSDAGATVDAGNLPAGLTFDAGSKTITGTPVIKDWGKDEESRSLTFQVTVKNSDGSKVVKGIAITVEKVHTATSKNPPIEEKPELKVPTIKPSEEPKKPSVPKTTAKIVKKTDKKVGTSKAPKTGDTTDVGAMAGLAGIAGVALALLGIRRKKNK